MRAGALSLGLVALCFLAFANAIVHPFVHDDVVFIVQNPQISRLDNLAAVFVPSKSPHPDGVNTYYRPLLEIVYRLEYRLFGLDPRGFHLFNVGVHAANGVLVFFLLRSLGLALATAWWVSAFFLIHPVQSEAVACVAGISNLLMAFFVLLSLMLYVRGRFFASVALFAAALLAKEQAVILPLVVAALDRFRSLAQWRRWSVFFAASALFLAVRQGVTGASLLRDIAGSPGELWLRVKAIAPVLLTDLRMVFAPYDLRYYRSWDILQPSFNSWLALTVLGLALLLVYCRKQTLRPLLFLGVGWFVLTLAPVLNIVPLINEYSLILTAEHFLYLPVVGVFIVIGAGVLRGPDLQPVSLRAPEPQPVSLRGPQGRSNLLQRAFLFFLLCICLVLTIRQNTFWSDEAVLFERTVRFEPSFGRGHMLLAKAYYFRGKFDQAHEHYSKAYRIMAGYAARTKDVGARGIYQGFMKGILFDWAHVFEAQGQWPRALEKYVQAIKVDGRDAVLYNNAGACFLQMNDPGQAKEMFLKALAIDPQFGPAAENLKQCDKMPVP